jgi:hypothetical protein
MVFAERAAQDLDVTEAQGGTRHEKLISWKGLHKIIQDGRRIARSWIRSPAR